MIAQPKDDITVFAKTNFRNMEKRFGIKTDDRRRHMYLIGKTGMGKTTVIENMVIEDIQAGRGLALIDPHGDLVEKILDYIPSYRINDVVYFNPSDIDHPIGFNVLESVGTDERNLVASGLMGVFTKIWAGVWSARMEYILNNCILALLEYPGSTMLGISRLLVDKKYRRQVVEKISDPIVRTFWVDEFANYNDRFRNEAIAPIQNKVGQFLSNSVIRNIVGQPKSTLNLRELMDSQKILLFNLSKGRIGEDSSALLGAMMITRIQLAAMSRVDIEEKERKDFYLYVDEFQNFATDSFANILSEARKYRLNLIIAHQYIGQLVRDGDTKIRDAVFGNVGTIMCFRVGAADSEFLAKEFFPTFTEEDLVNLTKYDVYMKLMIDGVASSPFSATTLAPAEGKTNNREKVIRVSRERYSQPRAEVEEKIIRWSGVSEMYRGAAEQDNVSLNEGDRQYRDRGSRLGTPSRAAERPPRDYRPDAGRRPAADRTMEDRRPTRPPSPPAQRTMPPPERRELSRPAVEYDKLEDVQLQPSTPSISLSEALTRGPQRFTARPRPATMPADRPGPSRSDSPAPPPVIRGAPAAVERPASTPVRPLVPTTPRHAPSANRPSVRAPQPPRQRSNQMSLRPSMPTNRPIIRPTPLPARPQPTPPPSPPSAAPHRDDGRTIRPGQVIKLS